MSMISSLQPRQSYVNVSSAQAPAVPGSKTSSVVDLLVTPALGRVAPRDKLGETGLSDIKAEGNRPYGLGQECPAMAALNLAQDGFWSVLRPAGPSVTCLGHLPNLDCHDRIVCLAICATMHSGERGTRLSARVPSAARGCAGHAWVLSDSLEDVTPPPDVVAILTIHRRDGNVTKYIRA
jgi:hypothetical protein